MSGGLKAKCCPLEIGLKLQGNKHIYMLNKDSSATFSSNLLKKKKSTYTVCPLHIKAVWYNMVEAQMASDYRSVVEQLTLLSSISSTGFIHLDSLVL